MACIIRMSSDEFLDKFIKKHDYRKFNFLLISEDIKTVNKYKNVYSIPTLIPPYNVVSEFVANGYSAEYMKKYLDYISTPRVEAMITIMVKLCVIDNSNVIMLCSKAEDEFKYLDIICQYIEYTYGIKTYTYKKYKKDPEKCEKIDDKVKKKVSKILDKKIGEINDIDSPTVNKKQIASRIEDMSRKDMIRFLKAHGYKVDKDFTKKQLRKLIIKKISKAAI